MNDNNIQSIGALPPQISDSYKLVNNDRMILLFLNHFKIGTENLTIISPLPIEFNMKKYEMFSRDVSPLFEVSQRQLVSIEQFKAVVTYNSLIFGDLYFSEQNDFRALETFFQIDHKQVNLLICPITNEFRIDFQSIYSFIEKRLRRHETQINTRLVIFGANLGRVHVVQREYNENTLLMEFLIDLINLKLFKDIEEAIKFYQIQSTNSTLIDFLQSDQIETKQQNILRARKINLNRQKIFMIVPGMHINGYHFKANENNCLSCSDKKFCTILDSKCKAPLFLSSLHEYPLNYEIYDLIGGFFPAMVCQIKLHCYVQQVSKKIEKLSSLEILEQAIQAPSANNEKNYENLETLGDSVLKYMVSLMLFLQKEKQTENQMTHERAKIICNDYLSDLFQQQQICTFTAKIHYKKIRNHMKLTLNDCKDPILSSKQNADVYEALIGACYQESLSLLKVYQFLKMTNFKIEYNNYFDDKQNLIQFTKDIEYTYPLFRLLRQRKFELQFDLPLEQFQFKLKGLDEAFNDYERLEFLGDAALEHLIVSNIFKYQYASSKKLCPGMLHTAKIVLLDNGFMGTMALYYGYHKFMKLKDEQLIEKLINELNQSDFTDFRTVQKFAQLIPKYIADTWESVAGCVILELGWQGLLSTYGQMYEPFIKYVAEHLDEIYDYYQEINRNIQKGKQL